jgi:histidinol-phosphate aminotransferase
VADRTVVQHRAGLGAIPVYRPGRTAKNVGGLTRRMVKLSSNELPYGPLPSVVEALHAATATLHRYPDFHKAELVEALAERLGVTTDEIAVDNGSGSLLQNLALVTAAAGDEIVYGWRSFEAYPIYTVVAGATSVRVPLDSGYAYDLDSIAAAVNERTRLVIICNPNNPTGTTVTAAALDRFLQAIPSDVVVALDEAYREFATSDDFPDGVDFARRYGNVVALRTFSKAYGLAGLRVGYAIAQPELISLLRRVAVGFSVSTLGQTAALASVRAEDELRVRVASIVAERERVFRELTALGIEAIASQANFLYLPTADAAARTAAFEARGVILRGFGDEGVRVTLGDPDENDVFLEAAAEVFVRA